MAQRDFSYGMGELVNATKSFGANLGGLLKDRLDKKEYDDFLAGPNKDFSQTLRSAQDMMMDESNPDAAGQGLRMMHGATQTLFDEAGKFPDNPYVAQRAKQVFDMNMKFMQMEFVQQHQSAMDQRAKTKQAQDIQNQQIKNVGTLASADASSASADLSRARAGKLQTDASTLFSGAPGTIQGGDDDKRAENMWGTIQSGLMKPKNAAEQKSIDLEKADIRTRRAQNKIWEMAGRGEKITVPSKLPGGLPDTHVYDPHNKDDLAAVERTIDPQEVDSELTMNIAKRESAAQKLDPGIFDRKYGVLVDPTKASAFNPITREVPESTVGKIMFGVGGWNQLKNPDTKSEPSTVTEALSRLPDSIDKVSGPIASLFQQMPILAKDENIDSVDKLKAQMLIHGMEVSQKTFGDNADEGALTEGQKKNRRAAALIVQAMTMKYGDEIAVRMGLKKATPPPRQQPAGLSDRSLLRGFAGDVLAVPGAAANKMKRLYTEYTE